MRRSLFLILAATVLLLLPAAAHAQTITPQLAWNTTDPLARVTAYTTTLQVGAGTVTQVTPACVTAGTGTSCLLSFVFDATKPTTLTVVVIDPATGRSANSILNYTPGVPPASLTLTLGWKITIP